MIAFAETSCQSAHVVQRDGVVDRITPTSIDVRIVRQSACGGCGMSARCNASECRDLLVSVPIKRGVACKVGDRVRVVTSSSSVRRALLLGFTIPLILLLGTIAFSRVVFHIGEMRSAVFGLLVLIPYYILLYLCRKIVGRGVYISIEKYE